jgi:hypothetical protein
MWRTRIAGWAATVVLLCAGCMSGPWQDNPLLVRPRRLDPQDNPVYLALGPQDYGAVFEKVLDVVDDYWEIAYSNRYDGRIETFPRVAPAIGEIWRPGSPDFYQRLLATFQSIRHRAVVLIKPAEDGGFFIDVKVYKELEDLPQPTQALAGPAIFQNAPTVERQFEVIDAAVFEGRWIPIGRDVKIEQVILCRLAHMDVPLQPAPVFPANPGAPPLPPVGPVTPKP